MHPLQQSARPAALTAPARRRAAWPCTFVVEVAVLVALAILLLSGCSTGTRTNAPPPSTVTVTSAAPNTKAAVSAETIAACRSLAEDKHLAAYWRLVGNANGKELPPSEEQHLALFAVERLDRFTKDPLVDDVVGSTMRAAARGADELSDEWVETGKLDPDRFRSLITPIVNACQAHEIDMSVPA
jgi:hypothetical protein